MNGRNWFKHENMDSSSNMVDILDFFFPKWRKNVLGIQKSSSTRLV